MRASLIAWTTVVSRAEPAGTEPDREVRRVVIGVLQRRVREDDRRDGRGEEENAGRGFGSEEFA